MVLSQLVVGLGCEGNRSVSVLDIVQTFSNLHDFGQLVSEAWVASKVFLESGFETLDEDLHGFSFTKVINLGLEVLKCLDVTGDRTSLLELIDLASGK